MPPTGLLAQSRWFLRTFSANLWVYLRYQMVTKILISFLAFPLAGWASQRLIESTGRTAISSGDYLSFIFSFQGLGMLLLGLALLAVMVGLDLNAFIIQGRRLAAGQEPLKILPLIKESLRALGRFFHPLALLLVVQLVVTVPLAGAGLTLPQLGSFKIPNFITWVIDQNAFYTTIYLVVTSLMLVLNFLLAFTFPALLVDGLSLPAAMKRSIQLVKGNFFFVISRTFGANLLAGGLLVLLLILFYGIFTLAPLAWAEHELAQRFFLVLGTLGVALLGSIFAFLALPYQTFVLTSIYSKLEGKETSNYRRQGKAPWFRRSLLTGLLAGALALTSLVAAFNFDAFFRNYKDIEIVAHRAGGDLAAENSVAGLVAAADRNIPWLETDIQRAGDGSYIVNHDDTFSRVSSNSSGDPRQMTLEEIRQVQLKDSFDPSRPDQPVATFEDFLEAAQTNNIGVYWELKGSTADEKMVDDLVARLKEANFLDRSLLISLDYKLIQYIEEKYPEVETGYLFFFSVGSSERLVGDYLIMEEAEATDARIARIHAAGKKAIVWTVNSWESAEKFGLTQVDGIITDFPLLVEEVLAERSEKSDAEAITDFFFAAEE